MPVPMTRLALRPIAFRMRRCRAVRLPKTFQRFVKEAGVPPEHISLSTQELPEDFAELVDLGVKVNAW